MILGLANQLNSFPFKVTIDPRHAFFALFGINHLRQDCDKGGVNVLVGRAVHKSVSVWLLRMGMSGAEGRCNALRFRNHGMSLFSRKTGDGK